MTSFFPKSAYVPKIRKTIFKKTFGEQQPTCQVWWFNDVWLRAKHGAFPLAQFIGQIARVKYRFKKKDLKCITLNKMFTGFEKLLACPGEE